MNKKATRNLALLLLAFLPFPLMAANFEVPIMELYTWGRNEGGSFGLFSRGEMELQVGGGQKFGARVLFGFSSDSLEEARASTAPLLTFKAAGIQLRDLFFLPVDLSYFIGEDATFCSGEVFRRFFGTQPIASRYPSYAHFPTAEFLYEGIHTVNGTGIALDVELKKELALLSLLLYQDAQVDEDGDPSTFDFRQGRWAADLRAALNFRKIKLETFLGATYPVPDAAYGYYRGGLLFYAADQGVEFLAQVGIPRWAPGAALGIDLFYLLVEPRVRLGVVSVIPTFFWNPAFFLLKETNEQAFHVNLDFYFGDPARWPLTGGLEGNFVYQIEEGGTVQNEFRVQISPYLLFPTAGAHWEVRLNAKVWPYDPSTLLGVLLAVKAEF